MENTKTEVSILGPKLFHHDTWRVRINGEKWDYDHDLDCFINKHHYVVDRVDMPLLVVVGFHMAWNINERTITFGVPLPAEGLPKPWKNGFVFEVSACRGWGKRKL